MSDEVPDTVDKGIKSWLGAVAFTAVLIGGELMREDYTHRGVPFWIGVGLILIGLPLYLSAAWWKIAKEKLDARTLETLKAAADKLPWWARSVLIVVLAAVLAQFIPDFLSERGREVQMAKSSQQPSMTSSHVDAPSWNAAPGPSTGPIGPITAVEFGQTLNKLPKPCLIQISSPQNSELKNTLYWIVTNGSSNGGPICSIKESDPIPNADDPPPKNTIEPGVIVHWKEANPKAEELPYFFAGLGMMAKTSHALPPGSPDNLVWIDIGPGSPWR